MLLTNGCSFTEGYYLNKLENSWAFRLGDMLHLPVTNLALGGGSNQRIFRTTLDHLCLNTPDYLVIGWTDVSRFEIPIYNGEWARVTNIDTMFHEELKSNPDPDAIKNFYYKYCHNPYITTDSLLTYIITLQTICDSKGIKFFNFNAFSKPNIDDVLSDYYEYYKYEKDMRLDNKLYEARQKLLNKVNQIDKNKFWAWDKETMQSWCKNKQVKFDNVGHPLEDGHNLFAEMINMELTSLHQTGRI